MAETNSSIILPAPLFTDPRSLKALANGYFYVGTTDTDPTSPVNQIPVYNRNEDGSLVQVSQPISIGVGGYPVLNGIPFVPIVEGNYSIAIFDSIDVQRFYFPYVSAYQPTSASLSALSDLTPAANKLPYFTGPNSAALSDLTSVGRDIIAKNNVDEIRTYIELGNSATRNVGTTTGTVAAGDDSRFDMMFGVNQTYQDVLSSRVANTVYTNSTGKPIFIVVSAVQDNQGSPIVLKATIDGKEIATYSYGSSAIGTLTLPVPNGSTYKINVSNGTNPRVTNWLELRA